MEYLPKWPGVHDGETASTGRVFHASTSSGVFTGCFHLSGKLEVDRSGERRAGGLAESGATTFFGNGCGLAVGRSRFEDGHEAQIFTLCRGQEFRVSLWMSIEIMRMI